MLIGGSESPIDFLYEGLGECVYEEIPRGVNPERALQACTHSVSVSPKTELLPLASLILYIYRVLGDHISFSIPRLSQKLGSFQHFTASMVHGKYRGE